MATKLLSGIQYPSSSPRAPPSACSSPGPAIVVPEQEKYMANVVTAQSAARQEAESAYMRHRIPLETPPSNLVMFAHHIEALNAMLMAAAPGDTVKNWLSNAEMQPTDQTIQDCSPHDIDIQQAEQAVENTADNSKNPPIPSDVPPEIKHLLDCKSYAIPVKLIAFRDSALLPFTLEEEHGVVFLGLFMISAVTVSGIPSVTYLLNGGLTPMPSLTLSLIGPRHKKHGLPGNSVLSGYVAEKTLPLVFLNLLHRGGFLQILHPLAPEKNNYRILFSRTNCARTTSLLWIKIRRLSPLKRLHGEGGIAWAADG